MQPITGHCHPSSSGLLGNLEEKMTKNFDKITDRMKRKLNPKGHGNIFVPSSSAANGSLERPLPRSTSQVDTPNHLTPNTIDQRRQSAPSPVSRGPALIPPNIPAHQSPSMDRRGAPPDIGFLPLTIDTLGGEYAGSGYGWLAEDAQEEAENVNSSRLQAQRISLAMVQQKIQSIQTILERVQMDNQRLDDFIAYSFAAQIANPERTNMVMMDEKIEELRREIANLRHLSPRSVPPERPPRPNAPWWACPLCADHCPVYEFHCKSCQFPRAEIDPNEVVYCNCPECMKAVAERLFVSVTPEDDWMMVNRLNQPVKK